MLDNTNLCGCRVQMAMLQKMVATYAPNRVKGGIKRKFRSECWRDCNAPAREGCLEARSLLRMLEQKASQANEVARVKSALNACLPFLVKPSFYPSVSDTAAVQQHSQPCSIKCLALGRFALLLSDPFSETWVMLYLAPTRTS